MKHVKQQIRDVINEIFDEERWQYDLGVGLDVYKEEDLRKTLTEKLYQLLQKCCLGL